MNNHELINLVFNLQPLNLLSQQMEASAPKWLQILLQVWKRYDTKVWANT